MKNTIGIAAHIHIGKSTTTRIVEEIMKQEKTVLVVGSVENNPPQPIFPIVPYPPLPELPELIAGDYLYSNYGNKISSRAARRKKERDSKKRKRK